MVQTRVQCYDTPLQIKMKETTAKLLKRLKIAYQASKKTKRGLIDGLGTLAKTPFGMMDVDDEKQTLQHAMKNQIKILNTTNAHVDNVEKHFIILNAIIKNFTNNLTHIIEHMTSAKSGTIDIKLIPIKIILDNLKETASQIQQETHFPFQISTENWRTIEKFLTISAYHDNANIFTIIKIPLIIYPEYKIIKITPLPMHKANKTFIFIEVNQPIITIDVKSQTYFTPAEGDLDKCVRSNNQYVCEQNYPIHYIDDGALCKVQVRSTYN
ncbi:hypothetical protein ACFW04_014119 [Cataglyphis niger]